MMPNNNNVNNEKTVVDVIVLYTIYCAKTLKDVKKFLASSQFYLDLFHQKCYDMDTRGTQ